jgi:hypothetical protein
MAVACAASANEMEKTSKVDTNIEIQASDTILIYPDEQFKGLVEAGQYTDAIQVFESAAMHYKVKMLYDFTKNPVDSPEIDLMLVKHLKQISEISEIIEEGTEARAGQNGASGKILNYLGAKYGFASPPIDVWSRSGQRVENKKIKDVMPIMEQALRKVLPEKMMPPQAVSSLPSADTTTGNHETYSSIRTQCLSDARRRIDQFDNLDCHRQFDRWGKRPAAIAVEAPFVSGGGAEVS